MNTTIKCVVVCVMSATWVCADSTLSKSSASIDVLAQYVCEERDVQEYVVQCGSVTTAEYTYGVLVLPYGVTSHYQYVRVPDSGTQRTVTTAQTVAPFYIRSSNPRAMAAKVLGIDICAYNSTEQTEWVWPWYETPDVCRTWCEIFTGSDQYLWEHPSRTTVFFQVIDWLRTQTNWPFCGDPPLRELMARYPRSFLRYEYERNYWYLGDAISTLEYYRGRPWSELHDIAVGLLTNMSRLAADDIFVACEVLGEAYADIVWKHINVVGREYVLSHIVDRRIVRHRAAARDELLNPEYVLRAAALMNRCGEAGFSWRTCDFTAPCGDIDRRSAEAAVYLEVLAALRALDVIHGSLRIAFPCTWEASSADTDALFRILCTELGCSVTNTAHKDDDTIVSLWPCHAFPPFSSSPVVERNDAIVYVEVYNAPLEANVYRFNLRRVRGYWCVVDCELLCVS